MLIFRGGNWPQHRPWFRAVVVIAVLALAWYAVEGYRSGTWPGGSSAPGFVYGVIGGVIILFEMLLWPRKKLRAVRRVGRAQLWMKAHIWLGLLCVPLLVLHSGFRWWNLGLSGVLTALFFVVVASGVWGLVLQQILPSVMLEELPAETIHSQIDSILSRYLEEARRLLRATCGQDDRGQTEASLATLGQKDEAYLVIGAVRSTGRFQGKVAFTQTQNIALLFESTPLLLFFEKNILPFFTAKTIKRLPLGSSKRAAAMFRELKNLLDPAAHKTVDALEELCDQRRQFARQAQLHFWLHSWLHVHLPLSAALFIVMLFHVFYAMKYF